MLLMQAAYITRSSGKGVGPGNREFLGPVKWHQAIGEYHLWLKKLKISRAKPLPLALVKYAARIKSITHWAVEIIGA
jgi:hypothetical protein